MVGAKSLYHHKGIMQRAWSTARYAAKHHGGKPSEFFRECLRQSWALAKKIAADVIAMRQRVMATVAELQALHTPEATAKRAAEMVAFHARFGPGRHRRAG